MIIIFFVLFMLVPVAVAINVGLTVVLLVITEGAVRILLDGGKFDFIESQI